MDQDVRPLNVAAYVEKAIRTHGFLASQDDLSPRNLKLNGILSSFVRETMKPRSAEDTIAILDHPELEKVAYNLRGLLGKSEYEMEVFCARAMLGQEKGAPEHYASFNKFIYMDNYEALVDLEMKALGWPKKQPGLNRDTQSVAFVGAGPLPISAILLHLRTGLPMTCIDSDDVACQLGARLLRHLAVSDPRLASIATHMSYAKVDGKAHDYITHPVVFVASLVDKKDDVIFRIMESSNTGSTVVVRTAEGLSQLLYAQYNSVGGGEDYNLYYTGQTPLSSNAINTSIVYKFPSGKRHKNFKTDYDGKHEGLHALTPQPKQRWRTGADATPI